jgi:hypothetical protein
MPTYEVTVGGIGIVHAGNRIDAARVAFEGYCALGRVSGNRTTGETVSLYRHGVLVDEVDTSLNLRLYCAACNEAPSMRDSEFCRVCEEAQL